MVCRFRVRGRAYSHLSAVDGSGGTFQVRPYKDFIPLKGTDRLLSLRFLTELPISHSDHDSVSEVTSASEPRNAYDFMRRRKEVGGDPAMQTWNASVRLANFTNLENSPLCVSAYTLASRAALMLTTKPIFSSAP